MFIEAMDGADCRVKGRFLAGINVVPNSVGVFAVQGVGGDPRGGTAVRRPLGVVGTPTI